MKIERKIKYAYLARCLFLGVISAVLFSCNISKHVPENDYLVKNVTIEIAENAEQVIEVIEMENLYELLKQRPNRKLFSKFRFHLRVFNISNQKRIDKKVVINQNKLEKVNAKIDLKNQKTLTKDSTSKIIPYKERKLCLGEKIQRMGEAPVLLNGLLTDRSIVQLNNYFFNKGYFNAKVQDSIIKLRNNQVRVLYKIIPGLSTKINSVKYSISDKGLSTYKDSLKTFSSVHSGDQFDTDVLMIERKKITDYFQNKGFYSFNKEFIFFEVDTLNSIEKVDLTLGIQNFKKLDPATNQVYELPHQQYKLNRINVKIRSPLNINHFNCRDSLRTQTLSIYNYQPIDYQKRLLKNAITFTKNDFYRKKDAEETYKRLIGLGLFKSVSLRFDTAANQRLNGYVDLIPAKTQSFLVSVDGTNNEGLFGLEGSMNYTHNNLFHGGEKLMLSFRGGIEMQLLLTDDENIDQSNSFNTIEVGPEFHFYIPKYFLINRWNKLKRHTNAKTELTGTVNYQERPDFSRWNQEFSFGWIVHEKKPITWHINPLLISAIDISPSDAFQLQIDTLNDQFIAASFQDHIIAGGLFSFEYNGQNLKKSKNDFYVKSTFEAAGGTLYNFHNLIGKSKDPLTNSYYDLFGIRYAHYQKMTVDLRYYQPFFYRSKMVYRFFGGVGVPRTNLKQALPFEKSFFVGGANGIRAWRARSLGPGSFLDSVQRYDKIGDIQLEGNIEARFPLSDWIEGALFVDLGNVWLLKYDSLRAAGQFKFDSFVDQIAVGGGFGIRFNLDFFIIRADIAIPLKNPSIPIDDPDFPLKSRWIFDGKYEARKFFHPVQFNLGIGYPF